ncbi:MAG TPA: pyruvate, phosphate dikinase [Candidatus Limnocylindrales bacterium]|nr:pyruvate, phosphate dikinase [Candidatus Limnocylindrales bacterium]
MPGRATRGSAAKRTSARGGGGRRAAATGRRTGARAKKWVYTFIDGKAEGSAKMRALLGGKGAGLAEMTNAGLPVPPGFTITTEACNAYFAAGKKLPPGVWDQVERALARVERATGKRLGDPKNPLLVSVRSGAAMSMPGMMDTVLNLGLNNDTRKGLAELTGNPRFAWDAYRRFIAMFGRIVQEIPPERFDRALEAKKKARRARSDADLKADALEELVGEFKDIVLRETKRPFPTDPRDQLRLAVEAVFRSWFGRRAVDYRRQFKIADDLGTAVNVQAMAFGNMGDDSGTGVAFTRDPNTGEKVLYGEYLLNAQGEDVVAGIRTPEKIATMKERLPKVYAQFERIAQRLERHYRDVQDLEFTIERGRLYMLQTRSAKRTARAAVKVATDMVRERLITKDEAIQRVDPLQVEQLLLPRFDEAAVEAARAAGRYLAKGLNASPGAATGRAVFDADRAVMLKGQKQLVVLVRPETSPDDFHGMVAATGILTARGGSTSHAAVVARGLGLPCVAGCAALSIDLSKREMRVGDAVIKEGDPISIDGTSGEVFAGELPTVEPRYREEKELIELLSWADKRRRLGVWVNADTPEECVKAREFGAEGVGLARTEHMFRQAERLPYVQDMIMADTEEGRRAALEKLLPFQQDDFREIYRAMDGLPVVVRLIDPPLHEFLREFADVDVEIAVARATGQDGADLARKEKIYRRLEQLHEDNPMLGLRGCRLLLVYPEILEMQIRAILGAAADAAEAGVKAKPEIMMPLVGTMGELDRLHEHVMSVAAQVQKERGRRIPFKFGTMIEIPRACLIADEIATKTEFFSFGTNDLTQTILGISRDDAQKSFLTRYVEEKIIPADPFQVLDRDGVGAMMRMGVERGRKTKPDLKIGICGEHAGEPSSVAFCHDLRLTYVSPSTYRVPVARLAAAQANLARTETRDR